ncbi:iron complex transport system substrate-binding protein [Paramicrobacterium humi]|uniref:Iron complex transport system substrate-binding protein n=1 Tax=Paramicrobacterium humi TaxID=640635 RepID=A0A1H4P946_9MICO|nr:iron-siderophore ABC transporter substrate-binding protein [Microbacterium humi]SEC03967.1 iron complex transport system substrate-binding protein [Microbacterium humi]
MKRTMAALAALAATALMLSGCSAASDAPESTPTSDGAFPVTIKSALGTATIPEAPKRVVSIGWSTPDIAVSLGVTPVAIEADTWAGDKDGLLPWLRDAIEKSGDPLPQTFSVYPEIDMDAIVKANPDLILAPQSGLTQDQYDVLSKLAPTVAYPKAAWQTSWTEQIQIVGKALGKPDKAQGLIDGINGQLADAAAEHPEFEGLSFAYVYTGKPGALDVYMPGDPRVDVLTELGFTEAPAVADLKPSAGTFTSTIGMENADLLDDVDVLFTWYNSEEEKDAVAAQELWKQIPAVKRGSVVEFISDRQLGMATSAITPLSVPWALNKYLPLIEEGVSHVDD